MHALVRAVARLSVMGAVMAAVVVGALVTGLGATTAIALGIVLAGVVGLAGVARRPPRPPKLTPTEEIEAMLAADPLDPAKAAAARAAATAAALASSTETTRVESMAQPEPASDPEANMPRWRRPSLLEARRSYPRHYEAPQRLPMRFGENASDGLDVRVVRYAVVPLLDRPDEVLGMRVSDLGSGDEVRVVGSSGAFLEVACPNGDQGYVHRTTLGPAGAASLQDSPRTAMPAEADDALSALLTARGLA